MILYKDSIMIPQHKNGLIRNWCYDGKSYYEGCGEMVNNNFNKPKTYSSGGTTDTAAIGLTLPVTASASGTWLRGEFLVNGSWKSSISAEEMIDVGNIKTTKMADGTIVPYYEVIFQVETDANNSESTRSGTITFRPNGWAAGGITASSDMNNIGGNSKCTISVSQSGKPKDPEPPQEERGSVNITFTIINTQVTDARVTVNIAGKTATYSTDGMTSVTNPYLMGGIPVGSQRVAVTSCYVKRGPGTSWQTGNATASPSSVTVRANQTANVTINIS